MILRQELHLIHDQKHTAAVVPRGLLGLTEQAVTSS